MRSIVSLVRCPDYDAIDASLERCLAPIGGMRAFVKPGDRTLLKVNLVSAREEKDAVTTSPALVGAAIREVLKAGGIPFVADSPALVSAAAAARKSGIARVCLGHQVPLVDLDEPILVANPRARRVRAFRVSSRLGRFDVVVNLPKLKTHGLVGMTGAVKNMLGCVPGKLKTGHHLMQPDPILFSEMLLDLVDTVPPALTIVDAVVGMEGPGPGSGLPRSFGLLVAGASAVAVDAVCARVLGFAEREVPTVWLARKRGLPEAAVENLSVVGERISAVTLNDLRKARRAASLLVPRLVLDLGKRLLTPRPMVLRDRCTGCGACRAICASRALSLDRSEPALDDARCIRCYCCQEICPAGAIELRPSFLGGLLGHGPA